MSKFAKNPAIMAMAKAAEANFKKAQGRDAEFKVKSACDVVPPTGLMLDNPLFEYLLSRRFLAYGRCYLSYAKKGSGKSTLSYEVMKQIQAAGGLVYYIETENAYDPDYMKSIGVNMDELQIIQPSTFEEGLEAALSIAKALPDFGEQFPDTPVMICFDSIAGIGRAQEFEQNITDTQAPGQAAKLCSAFYRQICPLLEGEKAIFWATNQLKDQIGGMGGFGQEKGEAMLGGEGQRFHSTYQFKLARIEDITETAANGSIRKIGSVHEINPKRNKLGIEGKTRSIRVDFYINGGGDWFCPLVRVLGNFKNCFVKKKGAWYSVAEPLAYTNDEGKAEVLSPDKSLREHELASIIARSPAAREMAREILGGIRPLPTKEEEVAIEVENKKLRKKKKEELAKDPTKFSLKVTAEDSDAPATVEDED